MLTVDVKRTLPTFALDVAFSGNGVLERLVIQAKDRRISVVDRRGPLGTNPKLNARQAQRA